MLVVVNYAANQSQCYVRIPFPTFGTSSGAWRICSVTRDYDREGNDLESRGLYLDMAPWRYHVFRLEKLS